VNGQLNTPAALIGSFADYFHQMKSLDLNYNTSHNTPNIWYAHKYYQPNLNQPNRKGPKHLKGLWNINVHFQVRGLLQNPNKMMVKLSVWLVVHFFFFFFFFLFFLMPFSGVGISFYLWILLDIW
jgi:hypothetical protein